MPNNNATRRDFLKTSSAATAGSVLTGLSVAQGTHTSYDETIRLGMIGCGSRCTGAAVHAMNTEGPTKLIAVCDAFEDRLQHSLSVLNRKHKGKVNVPPERQFVGLEGYKKLLETDIDVVLIAAPPGFRPVHFEAAVRAGKHVFAEKPVAVDAAGIRRFLVAVEESKKKNLLVQIGLQRRHERAYIEIIDRLKNGAIGDIIAARAYSNRGGQWIRPRKKEETEMEFQVRNWYYFNWLSGDHITEDHVANLDVINWLMGETPTKAQGQGGRQVRTGREFGEIYDHHMVEFTFGATEKRREALLLSQCRQIMSCWNQIGEFVHGSDEYCNVGEGLIFDRNGNKIWEYGNGGRNGHQQEFIDLFDGLRGGKRPNEGRYGAMSTMTSILGRMATYSGQEISMAQALASEVVISPVDKFTKFTDVPPVLRNDDLTYNIPMPGSTKVL